MSGRRVAIVGAGAVAFATAALLAKAGDRPVLWSPSGRSTRALGAGAPLESEGVIEGAFPVEVAASAERCLRDCELVVIALPLNGHRAAFDAIAPHIIGGQLVVVSAHNSFSALYLAKLLEERDIEASIVTWGTTLTRSRRLSDTRVRIATLRGKLEAATLPVAAHDASLAKLAAIFGERFVSRGDLLEVQLGNVNPQGHLGLALPNLTRIERGEDWDQMAHLTPAIGNLLEALDEERLALAAALGIRTRSLREHYAATYGLPLASVAESAAVLAQRPGGTLGPKSLESRYVTEDVPFGLVPLLALANLAGIDMPLHAAGVRMFGALYMRDFVAENDLLPAIGFDRLDTTALVGLCRSGWAG